jgi:hypothetical protein
MGSSDSLEQPTVQTPEHIFQSSTGHTLIDMCTCESTKNAGGGFGSMRPIQNQFAGLNAEAGITRPQRSLVLLKHIEKMEEPTERH